MFLYLATNFAYLSTLPLQGNAEASTAVGRGIQYAAEDRVEPLHHGPVSPGTETEQLV